MKSTFLFAVAVVCLVAAAACSDSTTAPVVVSDSTAIIEARALQLVKSHREALGGILYPVDRIAEEARGHSAAMASGARSLGNEGYAGRLAALEAAGVQSYPDGSGELVASSAANDPAGSAVAAWLADPVQRAILEDIRATSGGVGAARDSGGRWYLTLLVIHPRM